MVSFKYKYVLLFLTTMSLEKMVAMQPNITDSAEYKEYIERQKEKEILYQAKRQLLEHIVEKAAGSKVDFFALGENKTYLLGKNDKLEVEGFDSSFFGKQLFHLSPGSERDMITQIRDSFELITSTDEIEKIEAFTVPCIEETKNLEHLELIAAITGCLQHGIRVVLKK